MATTYTDATMGARAIGARTDNAGSGVTDVSAEEDRYPQVIFEEGWLKPSGAFQPVAGAGATMNVVIGSGSAKTDYYVVAGDIAGQGNYIVRLAGTTQTIALNAADGSLARKDEIYLVVLDDAYDSTGLALPRFAYRDGTPAASPSAPGPDASWDAYVLLATIDVPAAAADILACTITDERTATTASFGEFDSDTSAVPGTIAADDAASEGTAKTFSRSDHQHAIVTDTPGTIEPDDAAAEGVSDGFARGDHQHAIAAGTPSSITPDQSNAEGSATSFARSDHIHNVPAAVAGTIEPDDSAAEGSAASFARSDHQHAIATAAPSNIGTANSEGSASSFARSDHVHEIADIAAVGFSVARYYSASSGSFASSGTWYDILTTTITKPTGWGSYDIIVMGGYTFAGDGSDADPAYAYARFELDTSTGTEKYSKTNAYNMYEFVDAIPHTLTGRTGSTTVTLQGKRLTEAMGWGTPWFIVYLMKTS